jgi:AraC-like DNA-binding protein/quercetin dioxygenase-like cupin family protein
VQERLFHQYDEEKQSHPEASAYYYKLWAGYNMPFHTHSGTEIMYVISGSCRVDVEDRSTCEAVLKKGDFIILNAGIPHRLLVKEETACRMLNIEFAFAPKQGYFPAIQEIARTDKQLGVLLAEGKPYLVLSDPEEIYHSLRSLVLELDSNGTQSPLTPILFAELLIRISRLYSARAEGAINHRDIYMKQCMEFMHQHYDQDIQVKDIASSVNLHPSYLHRMFKSNTGKTMMEYLTEIRMEKAKQLLMRSDIPVSELSEYVGISSRQYFHAVFKRYTGYTPADYRRNKGALDSR